MIAILPRGYRVLIALALVGTVLCLFAFQAIADGKKADALESGVAGVAVLVGAYVLAKRTVLRDQHGPIRRSKRKWVDDEERVGARR